MTRLSRETIHMFTAYLWGMRSTCKRPDSEIGCVITTSDMKRILSIGYNGGPKQLPNDSCRNTVGSCGCAHAEANAITMVDGTIPDKVLFVVKQPCLICATLITHANISTVYYDQPYRKQDGIELLRKCGIQTYHMDLPCSMEINFCSELKVVS